MDYKLAKKLKDAGWKIDAEHFKTCAKGWKCENIPSLEELIEACGEDFRGLMREPQNDGTISWWCQSKYPHESQNHKTPKIAVAKLWLELNENSK